MSEVNSNIMSQADFDAFNAIEVVETPTIEAMEFSSCMAAQGLRQMAAILERLHSIDESVSPSGNMAHIYCQTVDQFKKLSRALGTFTKSADDNYFNCTRTFDGGWGIQVFTSRSNLCERVLLRVEDVPEQIIPEKIIPASKREVYGWSCGPDAKAVTKGTESIP